MNYIIAIGAFQALLATLLLGRRSKLSKADSLLLLLIICIGTHLAIKFCIYNVLNDAEARKQLNTFLGFSYGPLLYLYARKRLDDHFIPASMWYLFIPLFLGAIAYLTVVSTMWLDPAAGYQALHIYNNGSTWLMIGYTLLFTVLTWRVRTRYPAGLAKERELLGRLGAVFAILQGVSLFFLACEGWGLLPDVNYMVRAIVYSLLILVCLLILQYKFSWNVAAATIVEPVAEMPAQTILEPVTAVTIPEERKERKLHLSSARHEEILATLDRYLSKSKMYREPEISLDMLAQSVGLNKHHISEAMNVCASKSFYQYINEYRIDEIRNRMQQLTEKDVPVNVLSLAYGCGFKAKSSFNQHFKKVTGITPSEYLKAIRVIRSSDSSLDFLKQPLQPEG